MSKERSRMRPVRLKRGIYLLPNLFTTAALFAGFYAVVVAMRGDFQAAAIGILTAMVFDGLDGRVARWTHTESDFGREYDSLSDMVAFGLAPSLVFYQWGLLHVPEGSIAFVRLGWIAAFYYTVAAAMRLARFNSRTGSKPSRFFEGLPSPSAAGLVASALWLTTEFEIDGVGVLAAGYALTIVTATLMVSNFSYYSFKDFNLGTSVRFTRMLMVPLLFMLIAINPPLVFTALFFSYAISAPLWRLWRRLFRRGRRGRQPQAQADEGTPGGDSHAPANQPPKAVVAPSVVEDDKVVRTADRKNAS